MAIKIQLKRGTKPTLPTLDIGELGFCTDTGELFIGTSTGNGIVTGVGILGGTINKVTLSPNKVALGTVTLS
jgi:hypothetical protein